LTPFANKWARYLKPFERRATDYLLRNEDEEITCLGFKDRCLQRDTMKNSKQVPVAARSLFGFIVLISIVSSIHINRKDIVNTNWPRL